MLEMSNGYPNSTSPVLGGSPSPGPSPVAPNMQIKMDEPSKMSSPTTAASARPNLRVVIPNQQDEVTCYLKDANLACMNKNVENVR